MSCLRLLKWLASALRLAPSARFFLLLLDGQDLPALTRHEDHDWKDVDCVFCCLPHATTQEIISQLPEHLKVKGVTLCLFLLETLGGWC